jgi:two-component system, probable response regulator PhcQ
VSMSEHKVLLVDDEEQVLNSLKRTFRDELYDVLSAGSAEEALDMIRQQRVTLVICDYNMGGMNGLELVEILSRDHPQIITMMLTGQADINIVIKAINDSLLYKFIVKPWDNDELRVTVKRALEYRAIISENRRLISELRKRNEFLEKLEKENPGLLNIKRDDAGSIIID